jgi:electron transfer flavoprotein alpha subunit
MLAVVPVRDGALPLGGAEAVAEAGGTALLLGTGCLAAASELRGIARDITVWDAGPFAPASWARAIAPVLAEVATVVLPGSPDGRDLAPRLAHVLERPLFAGAVQIAPGRITLTRYAGRVIDEVLIDRPLIATLQPGVRGVEACRNVADATIRELHLSAAVGSDARVVEVLPPDPATVDLAEAGRIVGGGAGLHAAERFEVLRDVGLALGASMGGTRVVTDRGWIEHARQIGTTGVAVSPRLYLAFGISGAVQHTAGLGTPDHVVAVNTDEHCPMMAMADLAVVADANAVLDALARRLGAGR